MTLSNPSESFDVITLRFFFFFKNYDAVQLSRQEAAGKSCVLKSGIAPGFFTTTWLQWQESQRRVSAVSGAANVPGGDGKSSVGTLTKRRQNLNADKCGFENKYLLYF